MPTSSDVQRVLESRFGLEALRPLQAKIIERVMSGGDALVVMPTGSGKSLCYQLPALALPGPGLTLVFSPLIALMEDQVSALRRKGVDAAYINSTLSKAKREKRYQQVAEGAFEILYATPERMGKPEFTAALESRRKRDGRAIKLLAIDEAHCITKWGHDLRPAYQDVGRYRDALGSPPTIALTATATAEVRADILRTLDRTDEAMPLFAQGLDRPNLSLSMREVHGDQEKVAKIARIAIAMGGTGIVYFALIKDLERMAHDIRKALPDRRVVMYHGRLDPSHKKKIYDEFIEATPDERLLLCATNAFGMGVDKPDIRFIVHAQVPGSVEAYYQEVGRAGRDGLTSDCTLLYAGEDLAIQQNFVEWKNPPVDLVTRTAEMLRTYAHADFDVDELRLEVLGKGGSHGQMDYVVITLADLGVIEPTPVEGRFRYVEPLDHTRVSPEETAAKRKRDLERLLDMVRCIKSDDPRAFILDYFDLDRTSDAP